MEPNNYPTLGPIRVLGRTTNFFLDIHRGDPYLGTGENFMERVTEHLTRPEIEERIAQLVRDVRASDPRIIELASQVRNAFWTGVYCGVLAVSSLMGALLIILGQ